MTMEEIREIARRWNLKTAKVRKAELIGAIQAAEGNTPCFATPARQGCAESGCLWREDCLTAR